MITADKKARIKNFYKNYRATILTGELVMQDKKLREELFWMKAAENAFADYKKGVEYEIALDYASK